MAKTLAVGGRGGDDGGRCGRAGLPSTRPVTLIVPFPPGGNNTIIARIVAEKMSESLGRQVVVDNRAGAGGTLASRAAASSAPDGYTLLWGFSGTLAIAPSLYANAGYDVRKDFAPVGRVATAPSTLVVHPELRRQFGCRNWSRRPRPIRTRSILPPAAPAP